MVVLVGGSSTGKARACWEAIQALPEKWWLWHPIDPFQPEAAARDLDHVGPYTVVWLNEAQHYLMPADHRAGERICAGLRRLLRDQERAPVLVVATMRPEYKDILTTPRLPPNPYLQTRRLLANATEIRVRETFCDADLRA